MTKSHWLVMGAALPQRGHRVEEDCWGDASSMESFAAGQAIAMRRRRASTLASARMARIRIRTIAPNRKEKPRTVRPSGHSNSGAILLPPTVMLAGWCRLFHHTTERLMIGRLTAPTSA